MADIVLEIYMALISTVIVSFSGFLPAASKRYISGFEFVFG